MKVVYDLARQENVVEGVLDYVLSDEVPLLYTGASRIESAKGALVEMLACLAPVLKHPAFEEEAEWRLIYSKQYSSIFSYMRGVEPNLFQNPFPVLKAEYREARRMLVPYVALPLTGNDLPLQLVSVVVGPSPDEALSVETVTAFLQTTGTQVGDSQTFKNTFEGLVLRWRA